MTLRGFLILLCSSLATAGIAGAGAFQVIHDLRAPTANQAAITPVAARQAATPATTNPVTGAASVAPVAPAQMTNSARTNTGTATAPQTPPSARAQGTTTATAAAAPNPQPAPATASAPLPPLRPYIAACAETPPIVKKTVTASRKAIQRKPPTHVVATQRPRIVPAEAPPQVGYPTAQTYPYYAGYTYYSSYPPTTYYRAY